MGLMVARKLIQKSVLLAMLTVGRWIWGGKAYTTQDVSRNNGDRIVHFDCCVQQ